MPALWITLTVLLALAIVIWRLRLGLYAAFGSGRATADLTIGPFRIRLTPDKETKKTAGEPKKTGKPKKEPKDLAEAAKKVPKPTLADIRDAVETLWPASKKALRRTRRGIRIQPLRLAVTLGGAEDPAAAAELYGGLHALIWTGMPALEHGDADRRGSAAGAARHRLAAAVFEAETAAAAAQTRYDRQQGGRSSRRVTRKDGTHGRDNGQEETPQ